MRRLVAAGLILCAATTARADASLTSVHGEDISEGGYEIAIELRGLHAAIDVRQTFTDASATDAEAIYEFDLPSAAVVDGVSVEVAGKGEQRAFGAAAAAAIAVANDDGSPGRADLALLRVIDHQTGDAASGTSGLTRYELRVFPVPAGKAVTVHTRFVMPLEVADGRAILRLPARGDAGNLSRETGVVRFRPEGGILAYDHVHVDTSDLEATGGTHRFAHGRRGPLVLDATPRVRGIDPIAWWESSPLDAKHGTVALSVFVPRPTTTDRLPFDRVAILVDTSRSMEGATDAAAVIVDAIAAQTAAGAKIRTFLFGRNARAIDTWRVPDAAARGEIGKAIRSATLENGSDIGEALSAAARDLDDGSGERTLVVVVTDGLAPLDVTGLDLAQRLGIPRAGVTTSFVLVAPDGSALPDVLHGPLTELANRSGGMVLAVRANEATARASAIAAELGHPAPLHDVALTGGADIAGLGLPTLFPAGSGGMFVGAYSGAAPSSLGLTGTRGEHATRITTRRVAATELADVALASIDAIELAHHADDTEPVQEELDAAHDLVAKARRLRGLATDESSLVALDPRAPFAAERRKLAIGGGPFTRVAPSGEGRLEAHPPRVRMGTVQLRGELDARLIHGMIETGLVPRARVCFQPLLLQQRESEGTIHLDLELARGEVTTVRVARSDFPPEIGLCILDAAYQLDVPRTVTDDLPDTVYVVHYPLTFRSLAAGEVILPGDADSDEPVDTGVHVDPDQPLGNLPPP